MSDSNVTRGALWAWDLTAPVPASAPEPDGYVIVDAGEVCMGELVKAAGVSEDEVKSRLVRGSRPMVIATDVGEIAAGLWLSWGRESAPPIRRTFHFAADEVYAWGGWTADEHRGRGVFAALLRATGCYGALCEARVLWSAIRDENVASQRAAARVGYRPVLHLMSRPGVVDYRFEAWPVVYADERLVERARRIVCGDGGR